MNILDFVSISLIILALMYIAFWRVLRQVHDHVQARLDFLQQHTIPIHVEVDGKMIYCYNTQTQEFLCQGATVEQAQAAFQARYPECWGIVHSGDAGIIQQWAQLAKAQHGS